MPYDLMLSENGDLVFSATRDLQGVGGDAQVAQAIRTRLKIPRGTWDYDPTGVLGSMLHTLSNAHPDEIQVKAEAMVREALRPLVDISVDTVDVTIENSFMVVNVKYHMAGVGGEIPDSGAGLSFTVPAGG